MSTCPCRSSALCSSSSPLSSSFSPTVSARPPVPGRNRPGSDCTGRTSLKRNERDHHYKSIKLNLLWTTSSYQREYEGKVGIDIHKIGIDAIHCVSAPAIAVRTTWRTTRLATSLAPSGEEATGRAHAKQSHAKMKQVNKNREKNKSPGHSSNQRMVVSKIAR